MSIIIMGGSGVKPPRPGGEKTSEGCVYDGFVEDFVVALL